MDEVFLGLGSNLGDRQKNLEVAGALLQDHSIDIEQASPVYISGPWGFKSENNFLNRVIRVKTGADPPELLDIARKTEKKMGRLTAGKVYSDRIIDIDILFYGNRIISTRTLIIPHPLLHKRIFVLKPMSDIAPGFIHPVFNKSIAELLAESTDESLIHMLPD
ncbi:MAG: 2-amino-4-hydroxy-6-hydroxymethyldihydropteridine diphosphokinase [Bacteroidales bacterium]|nr:2-amino-4-hydroxy-6-hydroxymethyldihydropteridine diphosphokinase [Bacteroidales bacterium]